MSTTPDNYQSLLQPQSSRVGWCNNPRLFSHGLMGVGLTVAAWAGWSAGPAIAQSDGSTQFAQVPARARAMSTLTLLYVNPIAGDDAVGNGGERAPFKTITQALRVAQTNTVIVLIPGTYSAETGEVFPLKLKPGVTIQGDTRSHGKDILIQGGGPYLSPTFASQNVTILGAHQAGLAGVTVSNPNPRGYGLWIESASPVILENTFTGNTHDGISIVGSSAPVVRGNYFYANGANGVTIYGNSRPEIRENLFIKTGFGINIAQDAAPKIIGNRIVQNQDGIVVQANAQPIIRGNLIEQNLRDGVVAIAQARPDLGNTNDPGANIFSSNGRFDINSSASNQAISAFGNQLASDRTSGRIDLAGTDNLDSPGSPVSTMPAEPVSIAAKPATPTQPKNGQPLEVRVQPFKPVIPAQAIVTLPESELTAKPVSTANADFPALDLLAKPTPAAEPTVAAKPATVPRPVAAVTSPKPPTVEASASAPPATAASPMTTVLEPPAPELNSSPTPSVPSEVVVAATPRPTVTTTKPITHQPVAIAVEAPRPEPAPPDPAATPIEVPRPEVVRPAVQPNQSTQSPAASTAIPIEVPPPETTAIATAPPAPLKTTAIPSTPPKAPEATAIATAPPAPPKAAPAKPSAPAIATAPPKAVPAKTAPAKPVATTTMTAAAFPVPTELKPTSKQPTKTASQVATQPSPALRPQPIAAYSFRNRRPAPAASVASRSTANSAPSAKSRQPAKQITLPPIPKSGAGAIAIPVPPPESPRTVPVRVAARPSQSPQLPVLPPKPVAARSVAVAAAAPTSIEIPVPPPETNEVIPTVSPAPIPEAAIAAIPQSSSPSTSGDVLPVPGPDIPVGYGGGELPSVLVARNPLDATNSLPFSTQAASSSRYRVVVQVESEDEQAEVAAIAPNAFRTLSHGRMVMQVGSFNNRDNADKMMQTLSGQGLRAAIEPLN
ncbi:MAG TPA: DUF1565 domain-containing protein [Allocoleopsis sp.]